MTRAECKGIDNIERGDKWAYLGRWEFLSKQIKGTIPLKNLCWCGNHTASQCLRYKLLFAYGPDSEATCAEENAWRYDIPQMRGYAQAESYVVVTYSRASIFSHAKIYSEDEG